MKIAVLSGKGGAGKTLVACGLACALQAGKHGHTAGAAQDARL